MNKKRITAFVLSILILGQGFAVSVQAQQTRSHKISHEQIHNVSKKAGKVKESSSIVKKILKAIKDTTVLTWL